MHDPREENEEKKTTRDSYGCGDGRDSHETACKIPHEIQVRFKGLVISICSQYFNNRFLTVPSRTLPHLHMCLVDLNNYRNSVTLSLAPDTTTSSSFVFDHDMTIPRVGDYNTQNVRGFMFYTCRGKPRIYNPTTRNLVTLPVAFKPSIIEDRHKVSPYYFGHDPLRNQYIVVCLNSDKSLRNLGEKSSEHRVYVLKRGRGSWRKATPTLPHIPSKGGVCIDGAIYYLASIDLYTCVLMSFDIKSRDFNMIKLPRRNGDEPSRRIRNVSLVEYDGKVTMIDQTHLRVKGMLDLWVLENVGNKKWSKKTLVLQPSQLHLVNNETKFNVKGTTQNGKIFLIPRHLVSHPFHILCYDLQSNDMRKIEIKGLTDHWFSKNKSTLKVTLMDQSESLEILET